MVKNEKFYKVTYLCLDDIGQIDIKCKNLVLGEKACIRACGEKYGGIIRINVEDCMIWSGYIIASAYYKSGIGGDITVNVGGVLKLRNGYMYKATCDVSGFVDYKRFSDYKIKERSNKERCTKGCVRINYGEFEGLPLVMVGDGGQFYVKGQLANTVS